MAALVGALWIVILAATLAMNFAFPLTPVVRWLTGWRAGRALLMAGWAWVGWHLLVR